MRSTGKATLFTGIGLSVGVALWIFSGLQFQRDMGVLLVFGFFVNMIGAIVVLPALAHFLSKAELRHRDRDPSAGAEEAMSGHQRNVGRREGAPAAAAGQQRSRQG